MPISIKPLHKAFLSIIVFFTLSFAHAQNDRSYFNGMSVVTGNIKPDGSNAGINLQNELIVLKSFDSSAVYDVLYEFKNTTNQYGNMNLVLPITLYFNEFSPGKRSPLLDRMSSIPMLGEIFKVADPQTDTRNQIYNNFNGRLFIRRYVGMELLRQLGIDVYLLKNNTNITFKKILIEFKWTDEYPLDLQKNSGGQSSEVLTMEIKFVTDFTFASNEQFNVMCYMKTPTTICGINAKQIYEPYQIGYDKNWEGPIKNIYLQHDIFAATPVIPKVYTYTSKYVNQRDAITVLTNVTPAINDRIGFYAIKENYQKCGKSNTLPERSIIPTPVKNITASSWTKTDKKITGRTYNNTDEVGLSSNIQSYQLGNPTNLDMFSANFETKQFSNNILNNYITDKCEGDSSEIILKEFGNPIYAFDIAEYDNDNEIEKQRGNLQMQTAWCEGAVGDGKGEYIEFELTQAVKGIHIYNGNQLNKKTFDESSKADIIRFVSMDGNLIYGGQAEAKYSIIDMSIENLYPLKLPAGKYRIYYDSVGEGKTPVTCLSSITFDFAIDDEWYSKAYQTLEATYSSKKVN